MTKLEVIPPLPDKKDRDDLLYMRDVAEMLAVNVAWLRNHCTRIEPFLPHTRLGFGKTAKRRFKRQDILQFIEENMIVRLKRK
jgi:hypothetical protein